MTIYRRFVRPNHSGWTVDTWVQWLVDQQVLIPVPPRQEGVCEICLQPTRIRDDGEHWWRCPRCRGAVVRGLTPISYSWDGGLEPVIWRAKNDADHRWLNMPLASLLWRFLKQHLPCIEAQFGSIDLITMLPSHPSARDGWDHMRDLHGCIKNWPAQERWDMDLLQKQEVTAAGSRRGQVVQSLFTVNRQLFGDRVLLIDDTWTSGGSINSAADAIEDAGGVRPVALTIGRQFRADEVPREWRDTLQGATLADIDHSCAYHPV